MSVENIPIGVDILDGALPQGVLRNSLIFIAGPSGSGKTFLTINIMKSFLNRREPVFYVLFDDDPATLITITNNLGVDTYAAVKDRLLNLVDGFSFRIKYKKGKAHISVAEEVNPENTEQILYTLINLIDKLEVRWRGIVVIDSVNELLFYHDTIKVAEFIKNLKANVAKSRGILTLGILHTSTPEAERFLGLIEHFVDGVVLVNRVYRDGVIINTLTVKKMKGVQYKANVFEYSPSSV